MEYVLLHLQHFGVDLSKVMVQTDNGTEFVMPARSTRRSRFEQTLAAKIYDLSGRIVASFDKTPAIWQPEDRIGSGIYLVRAAVGEHTITKQIVYLK